MFVLGFLFSFVSVFIVSYICGEKEVSVGRGERVCGRRGLCGEGVG